LRWCSFEVSLLCTGILLLPLQMRNLHAISYVCSLSSVCMFAVVCVIAGSLLANGIDGGAPTSVGPADGQTFLDAYGAFGTIIFAFQGQSIFCEIMREMKDSRQFPRSLTIANGIMMGVYVFISSVAYGTQGTRVAGFLPDSMPAGPAKVAVNLLVAFISTVSYLVTGQPLHRLLHFNCSPDTVDAASPAAAAWWLLITGSLLVFSFVVANAIPFFEDLQALLGALTGAPIVFAFPALFYLRGCHIKRVRVAIVDKVVCGLYLCLFFPLFTILGVVNAVEAIVRDSGSNGAPFSCGNSTGG